MEKYFFIEVSGGVASYPQEATLETARILPAQSIAHLFGLRNRAVIMASQIELPCTIIGQLEMIVTSRPRLMLSVLSLANINTEIGESYLNDAGIYDSINPGSDYLFIFKLDEAVLLMEAIGIDASAPRQYISQENWFRADGLANYSVE